MLCGAVWCGVVWCGTALCCVVGSHIIVSPGLHANKKSYNSERVPLIRQSTLEKGGAS